MEKLIKSKLGQWALINTDKLKKAWVKDEEDSTPAQKMREVYPTLAHGLLGPKGDLEQKKAREKNKPLVESMFNDLHDAQKAKSIRGSQHHLDRIKNFINDQKEGHVDLGHLSQQSAKSSTRKYETNDNGDAIPRFSHHDLLGAFDKHIGKSKNLKELHDDHGMDAATGIARAHGVGSHMYDTSPSGRPGTAFSNANAHFDNLNNKPELLGDLQAFSNGWYGQHKTLDHDSDDAKSSGMYYQPDVGVGSSDPDADKHNKATDDAWHNWIEGGEENSHKNNKKFEDAVIDRGVSSFKHAHKLK